MDDGDSGRWLSKAEQFVFVAVGLRTRNRPAQCHRRVNEPVNRAEWQVVQHQATFNAILVPDPDEAATLMLRQQLGLVAMAEQGGVWTPVLVSGVELEQREECLVVHVSGKKIGEGLR